jgi:tetratricopeptide (TPR) repeat protein
MMVWIAILLVGLQDPAALSASAKEKSKKGDYKGAEADLSRAIEAEPGNAELHFERGDVRFSLGDWDRAIEDYSRAIDLAPDRWGFYLSRGIARMNKRDLDAALPDLNKAVELAPGEWVTYDNRGKARSRKGDGAGAEADYTKVIELKPKASHGYAERGQVREGAGDLDGALADFEKAIRFRTNDPQVYVSHARILFFQKKKSYGKAMEEFDMATRLAPKFPFGFLFRGFARLELDENPEAIDDLSRAIELDPGFSEAYRARGTARRNLGDRKGAIADYTLAAERDPSSGSAHQNRGCTHSELGEWAKALEDFQESIRREPEQRDYPRFRIWICRAHLKERDAATRDLQTYLQTRHPKDADDWAGKVGAFLVGQRSEQELESAAKTPGERCEAAFYIGSVKLIEGDREAARTRFEECLKTQKRTFLEYVSAAAALETLAPGPRRPPVVPGRMKIEILHVPGACAALEREPVCKNPEHWRFWVDGIEYPERELFFAEVLRQGKTEVSDLVMWSDRRTLLWASAKAPFARITEALTACVRAGIGDYPQIQFRGDADGGPLQRDPKVTIPEKEHDVGEEAIDVSLAWEKGMVQWRVGKSPWSTDDAELLAEFQEAGVTTGRSVLFDPAPDVPYGEALRIHRLCRRWNLQKPDFRIPFTQDPGPRPWGAVTADEAEKFARALEEAAAAGAEETFDRAVAWQEMLRRIIGDASLSPRMQWLVEDTHRSMALCGKRLAKPAESSRPLHFLRMKTVDGAPRPFFRILSKDTYDYVELELGKGKDGSILILDIRRLTSDGSESQFLRHVCLPPKEPLKVLNLLKAPMTGDIAASYPMRWQLTDLAFQKKFEEGLKFFAENRAAFRSDTSGHRAHLSIARNVGPEAYAKAVADLEEDLPNDTVLPLLRVERAILSVKQDDALAAVDALEKVVGEDPYLLVIRASVESSRGRSKAAKELAARATEKEPMLDRAWWTLLNTSVSDRDYDAAVRALNALENRLKIVLPDFGKSPGFESFSESREYQDWKQSHQ